MESSSEKPLKKLQPRQSLNLKLAKGNRKQSNEGVDSSTAKPITELNTKTMKLKKISLANLQKVKLKLPEGKNLTEATLQLSNDKDLNELQFKLPNGNDLGELKLVMPTKKLKLPKGKDLTEATHQLSNDKDLNEIEFKLPNGNDLDELKLATTKPEEKVKKKVIKMSKVGSDESEKPITVTIKSQVPKDSQKPKIKSITKLPSYSLPFEKKLSKESEVNSSLSLEKSLKELKEACRESSKIQNSEYDLSINTTPSNNKTVVPEGKSILSNLLESNKEKVTSYNSTDLPMTTFNTGEIIKLNKYPPHVITLKKGPDSQVMVTKQQFNKIEAKHDETLTDFLKPVPIIEVPPKVDDSEEIIFKSKNGSTIRKKSSCLVDHIKINQTKKVCLKSNAKEEKINHNLNENHTESIENSKQKESANQVAKDNVIMVVIPNEAVNDIAKSSDIEKQIIRRDEDSVMFSLDDMLTEDDLMNGDFTNLLTNNSTDTIQERRQSINTYESNNRITNIKENSHDRTNLLTNNSIDSIRERRQSINACETNNRITNIEENCRDLFDDPDLLEEAIISIEDAKLREKAIRALKNCGIRVKKKVPIKRNPMKMINESETQTDIYSFLEDGEFVEIRKTKPEVKQSRKIIKQPMSVLSAYKLVIKATSEKEQREFKSKLHTFIKNEFGNNDGISIVKEACAKNQKGRAKSILEQIQKDYEAAKNYDGEGLLGIHRAVKANNLQEVQRHIILLRATKHDIDVCSEDEKTSLELAIEHEVNPQIVKILLDAGAQPVSTKPKHESAILLAAKSSSKILPLLFKYVKSNHYPLLDACNFEGFAAIHYCAENGDLDGITELIKHQANINALDERSGKTALILAMEAKHGCRCLS